MSYFAAIEKISASTRDVTIDRTSHAVSAAQAGNIQRSPFWPREIFVSYDEAASLRSKCSGIEIHDCRSALAAMSLIEEIFLSSLHPSKIEQLRNFRDSNEYALVIRNMPVDYFLPPTPYATEPSVGQIPVTVVSILGAFACIGISPVSYQGENDNSFIRHVVPKHLAQHAVSSYGSKVSLGMHADDHLPLENEPITDLSACPEFLSLMGVRCELGVPTRVVSVERLLGELPQFAIEELQRPHFSVKRPDSFADNRFVLQGVPLLVPDGAGGFYCRYNRSNVRPDTVSAKFVIEMLETVVGLPQLCSNILLQQGDLLIFKNQRTLHARDQFTPRFDGTDRWMIRVFGLRHMSRGIPVSADYPFVLKA
jgi:hypothetical protein